jgi:amicyanin
LNKQIAGVLIGVVALALIGGGVFAVTNSRNNDSTVRPATGAQADTEGHDHNDHGHDNSDGHHDDDDDVFEIDRVEITNFDYVPNNIKVSVGTTVTWTNKDSARHDVASDQETSAFVSSKLLGQNETYSFTFTKAGTYSYHCSPHPYMKGTVEVTE